jgi:hypothetical protein
MKNTIETIGGLMRCTVAEFKPQEYKGLRSGIGKERKSSKHFKCHNPCCSKSKVVKGAK